MSVTNALWHASADLYDLVLIFLKGGGIKCYVNFHLVQYIHMSVPVEVEHLSKSLLLEASPLPIPTWHQAADKAVHTVVGIVVDRAADRLRRQV